MAGPETKAELLQAAALNFAKLNQLIDAIKKIRTHKKHCKTI